MFRYDFRPVIEYTSVMERETIPLKRRKLSDEIQEHLLELIKLKGMKPGDVLPSERELMSQYSVGRPAIREAMQNLQRMGLVSIRHGGRPRIAKPSLEMTISQLGEAMRHVLVHSHSSMEHLKQARVAFESGIAGMAAQERSEADIERLEQILSTQEASQKEPLRFIELDGQFHRAIAASTGNPLYESLSAAIFNWLSEFYTDQVRKPGLEQLTLDEHRSILSAISRQEPAAASKAMRDHLNRANALYHQDNRN